VAHQAYYSRIGRDYEYELMPLGLDQGVGAIVWSPLGWGRLTGKIRRGQPWPAASRLHDTAGAAPPVDASTDDSGRVWHERADTDLEVVPLAAPPPPDPMQLDLPLV
jgi:aryl-alcohol dehydrogenase-like predicted oxidoreductase